MKPTTATNHSSLQNSDSPVRPKKMLTGRGIKSCINRQYTLEKEIRLAKRNYSDKLRIQFSSSDSASVWKGLKEITTTRHHPPADLKKHPTPALYTSPHNHYHLQQPPFSPTPQFRSAKTRCTRSPGSRKGKKHQAQTVLHQSV